MRLWIISLNADPRYSVYGAHGGGQGSFVRTLAQEMSKLGWRTTIITSSAGSAGCEPKFSTLPNVIDLECPEVPHVSERREIWETGLRQRAEDLLADKPGPSVVLGCHAFSWPLVKALADRAGCPIAYSLCSTGVERAAGLGKDDPLRYAREREIVCRSNVTIASSATERRILVSEYDAQQEKLAIIPRPLDTDLFSPDGEPGVRGALFVGRPTEQKGLDIFLRALDLLGNDTTPATIAGSSYDDIRKTPFLAPCRPILCRRQVKVVGGIDQPNIPTLFRRHSVLVMPSRYETYGNLAVEAMACGLPVIASDVGALRQHIEESKAGMLTAPESPREIADRLRELKSRQDTLTIFHKNGPIYARQFDKLWVAKAFSDLFQQVTGGPR